MMATSRNRTLKLGLLVTVGLLLFIVAIYYLGSKQSLFTPKITVKSYLSDAAGLVVGNNIRYSGVNVGTVTEVSIVSDTSVLVVMSIDQKAKNFIRKDSKVEIGREGLLGSKILYINPGTMGAGRIEEGDVLESLKALDIDVLLQEAAIVVDNAKIISDNLVEIIDKINHGNGDLSLLLNNNTVTNRINDISNEIISVTESAKTLIQKIDEGEGDLGMLINDTVIHSNVIQVLDNLDHITSQTDSLIGELRAFGYGLNSGSGLVPSLVYDSTLIGNVDTTLIKLNSSLDEIEKTAKSIRESWIVNLFSGKKKK